jgi:hypothetical protein
VPVEREVVVVAELANCGSEPGSLGEVRVARGCISSTGGGEARLQMELPVHRPTSLVVEPVLDPATGRLEAIEGTVPVGSSDQLAGTVEVGCSDRERVS